MEEVVGVFGGGIDSLVIIFMSFIPLFEGVIAATQAILNAWIGLIIGVFIH